MNNKLWFSSDTHYSHANILHHCNRSFLHIYEHDEVLIDNHNSVVDKDDDYFFLGDFAYRCSPERVSEIINKLNGHIYIILGNHDKPLIQAVKRGLLTNVLNNGKLTIFGLSAILEDSTISISKMINVDGQLIFLSHYSVRSWPSSFRGKSWHLYGHSHNNLEPHYKSFDIGIDTFSETHKRFFPWSYEEIKERMDKVTEPFREASEVNN